MLPLFARAGAAMIPGASKLPLVGGGGRGDDVPDTVLGLDGVSVERPRLASYDRVCGFALRDELPCTFVHVLAFPLHLRLMTDPAFPFPALGLVHIENEITQIRPVRASEALDLRVWATALEPHPRGRKFDLRSEARVGGELVWEETSTILKRGGGSGPDRAERPDGPAGEAGKPDRDRAKSADLPRHRDLASGRRPRPALRKRVRRPEPDPHPSPERAAVRFLHRDRPWHVDQGPLPGSPRPPAARPVHRPVAFRKPILLPATVEFGERAEPDGFTFAVRGAGKATPHLDGQVRF